MTDLVEVQVILDVATVGSVGGSEVKTGLNHFTAQISSQPFFERILLCNSHNWDHSLFFHVYLVLNNVMLF